MASFKVDNDYKSGVYPFPSRDIDPQKKKSPEYNLKNAEAIYHLCLGGKMAVPFNFYETASEMRAYMDGNQDSSKYKSYLTKRFESTGGGLNNNGVDVFVGDDTTQTKEVLRKAYGNIDWESNISPMPKIMKAIHGMFDDVDYDVFVNAVDENSIAEEEQEKMRAYVDMQWRRYIEIYQMRAGITMQETGYIPNSREELEMYASRGGFKRPYAKSMEKLLKHTYEISNYHLVKEKKINDFAALNLAVTKDYYDSSTAKVKTRYVDPALFCCQYSKEYDYNNAEYAGEFTDWTISRLRSVLNIQEEELAAIAKSNTGYAGNPSRGDWDTYNIRTNSGTYGYDPFKVCVFEACWIDVDSKYEKVNVSKMGRRRIYEQEYGKMIDTENSKTRITKIRKVYKCSWIIGTKRVFDYGPMENQVRLTMKDVALPYHVVLLPAKSIISSMRTIIDRMEICWRKFQNALAKVADQGYMIDITMISSLSDGRGKKYDPLALLKMYFDTGYLLFMPRTVNGTYAGGATVPIQQVPGGAGSAIEDTLNEMGLYIKMIEETTGLNPLSLGSSPESRQAVGTSEISVAASSNVLRPMIRGCLKMKEMSSGVLCHMIQNIIKTDKTAYDQYAKVIGSTGVEYIKVARENYVEYGFNIVAKPNAAMKQSVVNALNIALEKQQIGTSEWLRALNEIENGGNLTEVSDWIDYTIKKAEELAAARQQQAIEAQNQGNLALHQEQTRAKLQEEQMKAQNQIAINRDKSNNTIKEIRAKQNAEFASAMIASTLEDDGEETES